MSNPPQQILLAIDPGKSGGFAARYPDGRFVLEAMPVTETEVCALLAQWCREAALEGVQMEALLERVGGFVGKRQPGAAMFTFGRGVGVLVGLLMALRIPFREVTPQAWQKAVGAGTSAGRSKAQWKRHLLDLARKHHPDAKGLTLRTCDALLIAESAGRPPISPPA